LSPSKLLHKGYQLIQCASTWKPFIDSTLNLALDFVNSYGTELASPSGTARRLRLPVSDPPTAKAHLIFLGSIQLTFYLPVQVSSVVWSVVQWQIIDFQSHLDYHHHRLR
jgi:hypothetical protein